MKLVFAWMPAARWSCSDAHRCAADRKDCRVPRRHAQPTTAAGDATFGRPTYHAATSRRWYVPDELRWPSRQVIDTRINCLFQFSTTCRCCQTGGRAGRDTDHPAEGEAENAGRTPQSTARGALRIAALSKRCAVTLRCVVAGQIPSVTAAVIEDAGCAMMRYRGLNHPVESNSPNG